MLFQPLFVKGGPSRQPGDGARKTFAGNAIPQPLTIGVLSNPRSGGNKRGIGTIRDFVTADPGVRYGEAVTSAEVEAVLADFAVRGVDFLVVNGGDGTIQAVLTTVFGRRIFPRAPILALLQAGTASMIARDVGVCGQPLAALLKIRDWCDRPEKNVSAIHECPVLHVCQQANPKAQCGMFFGAGAISRGIELAHGSMNPNGLRGELIPGLIMIRLLLAVYTGNERLFSPTHMRISIDKGPSVRGQYLFALVSTLERLFLGLHPFWGTEQAPLHFTAVTLNPFRLLLNLPFLLRGRRTASVSRKNGYVSHNTPRITLNFRGSFTLDGEIYEAVSPVTIEPVGPARFLKI